MAKKKKHHEEGHVNHERWLVTYADMLTLLMVLFIVLFSMGQTNMAKHASLKASLAKAFDVTVLIGADAGGLLNREGTAQISLTVMQEVLAMTGNGNPDPRMVRALQDFRDVLSEHPTPRSCPAALRYMRPARAW